MKIYTKTGDSGETGLFAGPRVAKDHPRIAAYGAVDELNSVVGLVRTEPLSSEMDELLAAIQHDLFSAGAELATPNPTESGTVLLEENRVDDLEAQIDAYEQTLPPLKTFILPGGSRAAALMHFARSVCRRSERRIVSLRGAGDEQVSDRLLRYFNRLGDLFFVLARAANAHDGKPDIEWRKPGD